MQASGGVSMHASRFSGLPEPGWPFAFQRCDSGKVVSDHSGLSSALALPERWVPGPQAVQVGVVRVAVMHGDEGGLG